MSNLADNTDREPLAVVRIIDSLDGLPVWVPQAVADEILASGQRPAELRIDDLIALLANHRTGADPSAQLAVPTVTLTPALSSGLVCEVIAVPCGHGLAVHNAIDGRGRMDPELWIVSDVETGACVDCSLTSASHVVEKLRERLRLAAIVHDISIDELLTKQRAAFRANGSPGDRWLGWHAISEPID